MLVNQPAILSGAFAAEGDKNTIPANNDGLSGLASIAKGFPPITQQPLAQGGLPPQRQDFNGIFNLFSQFLLYAQNGGVYAYNNTLDYQPPAIISHEGVFYSCIAENGPSTSAGVQPVTNTVYWEKLVPDVAVMTGATSSAAGASGLVPVPGAGDNNKVLFGDGTFKTLSNQLQRNTAYQYGDIAYSPNLPSWAYLFCVTAGTTAASEPSFASVNTMGQYITDGTVKWIVDDIRFNTPVGVVFYDSYLHAGCVKYNGATVQRSDYVRIAKIATDENLWTESPSTEPWKFGVGDGSTTMTLPDFRSRFIEGSDNPSVVAGAIDYIVNSETGSEWWRIYDSGWIEQSGFVQLTTSERKIITLPIDMADTSYTVILQSTNGSQTDVSNALQVTNITQKSFMIESSDYATTARWLVLGMAQNPPANVTKKIINLIPQIKF